MVDATPFSASYAVARQRFRDAAGRLGWRLESLPIAAAMDAAPRGPGGEELTIDVATAPATDAAGELGAHRALVVSSGVHGVEGFFGSAVQLTLLEQFASTPPPRLTYVFIHAVNPFGFAWLRRFDQDNVDLNRNMLLPGEQYSGAPAAYGELDSLLNPRVPPSRWEPFLVKALWKVARRGMPALRQAIAGGQYEFPKGLFFGGSAPSASHRLLGENMPRWLGHCQQVMHFDLHTGLGKRGTGKLLIDCPLSTSQRERFADWFGLTAFEESDNTGVAYRTRGSFGQWCNGRGFATDYIYSCMEYGTYGLIPVLTGLRAENQAFHWGDPDSAATLRAKRRLMELFCPASEAWRRRTITDAATWIERAARRLAELQPEASS